MTTLRTAVQQALEASRLREVLTYDQITGVFTWRTQTSKNSRRIAGELAGCPDNQGYLRIQIDGKSYRSHRLAWLYVYGEWPTCHIDHVNGCRSDNRIVNLRDTTREVNLQNQRKAVCTNKVGLLGVSVSGKSYRASIRIDGVKRHIGVFETAQLAHQAYVQAKRQHHTGCTI